MLVEAGIAVLFAIRLISGATESAMSPATSSVRRYAISPL